MLHGLTNTFLWLVEKIEVFSKTRLSSHASTPSDDVSHSDNKTLYGLRTRRKRNSKRDDQLVYTPGKVKKSFASRFVMDEFVLRDVIYMLEEAMTSCDSTTDAASSSRLTALKRHLHEAIWRLKLIGRVGCLPGQMNLRREHFGMMIRV